MLAAAFRAQPPELPILQAFRVAVNDAMLQVPADDRAGALERARLSYTIPEVRARAMDHMFTTTDMLAELFAERLNRSPDDLEVRVLAGTVVGSPAGQPSNSGSPPRKRTCSPSSTAPCRS